MSQEMNDLPIKRFESLFNYTNDVVFIADPQGRILTMNEKAQHFFKPFKEGTKVQMLFDGVEDFIDSVNNTQIVHSYRVLYKMKNGTQHPFKLTLVPLINKGELSELLIIAKHLKEIESFGKEMEQLATQVSLLEEENKLLKSQCKNKGGTKKLASALKELEKANRQLDQLNKDLVKELELASLVQKSLVPSSFPDQKHLRFTFHFEPMGPVGGDYYDIIELEDDKIGLIVADVSGHGVSSALIASMLKISFIDFAPSLVSPAELLTTLNTEYCRLIQTGDYVTAFYTILDPIHRKITYSGAGHPMSLLLDSRKNNIETLKSEGFFLGMFEGAEYVDRERDFVQGDRYLVYTDGIIEAFSIEHNAQFGIERLRAGFKKYQRKPAEEMLIGIISEVKSFMHKSTFLDDLAMVAVDYRE
jgi:serine phosphatase RsbU (regulator of sigma subunit)